MREQGWRLPTRTLVIPYLIRSSATGEAPERLPDRSDPVQRLALFGRAEEERKGFRLFIAALNALEPELLSRFEVEFVTGSLSQQRIHDLMSTRTRRALRGMTVETQLDQREALARLLRPGTLVVIPSLGDNSPNTVYECLEYGIPFIASTAGGIPELVAADDRPRVLFDPTPASLERAIRRALSAQDGVRPARPAFDLASSFARWGDVVQMAPTKRAEPPPEPPVDVDVVVVRRGSHDALSRCTAALECQTHSKVRVILADGSSVETARQAGLRECGAPFVVFLDEEDIADRELIATLVRAQAVSNADVVTCGLRIGPTQHFFSGEPGGLAALSNGFGRVALIRRSLLDDLILEWPTEQDPDWPLLARLAISGARTVSVPLPLVLRSRRPGAVEEGREDALLVVRQLELALPDSLRGIARIAAGLAADSATGEPAPRMAAWRRVLRRLFRRAF
jgi:hypothetical protein